MSVARKERKPIKSSISALLIAAVTGVHPALAAEMTAGTIMKEMPARERATYIMGIVEGIAYGRFRKDTIASGAKDEAGMKCILAWFYRDMLASYERIEGAFRQYEQHMPSTVVAAMAKKECGE